MKKVDHRTAMEDAKTGPPGEDAAPGGGAEVWPCPFCNGDETELMSLFGSHASLSTYWCRRCGSPFETLRWKS